MMSSPSTPPASPYDLPRLVISIGCPAGIGPEVSVAAARAVRARARVLLVGDVAALSDALRSARVEGAVLLPVANADEGFSFGSSSRALGDTIILPVLQPTRELPPVDRAPGRPTPGAGEAQLIWVETALEAVRAGQADALITGPVSKSAIVAGGTSSFRGHTEYLAARLGAGSVTMAFATPAFTTALVTTHIALSQVPDAINDESVARAVMHLGAYVAHVHTLRGLPGKPCVVVCALNPHAGEGGLMGNEEPRIGAGIATARAMLARAGVQVDVVGPTPAESAFRLANEGRFQGVLAMYHDQATIPMKLIGFGEAVNITLGLPLIRTSVDHGTAYDQAGKGSADMRGMASALDLAAELSRRPWPFRKNPTLAVRETLAPPGPART